MGDEKMSEVPWQTIITAVIVSLIIVCSSALAYAGVASWRDVFTIYLIVLAGLGFMASGIYYGQAKAYKDALQLIAGKQIELEQKRAEHPQTETSQPQERANT